jgi:flagellar protein FlgJ
MIRIPGTTPGTATGSAPAEERLRAATKQMEGVFVQELFKAMRETVPKDGLTDGGSGEDIFTGLMDEKIAAHVPDHWERGIGDSLYRQLHAVLQRVNPGAVSAAADDKRIK